MSFTRTKTDICNYNQELEENVSYVSYLLDPVKFHNCNKCRPELGFVGGTNVSHVTGNLIDLESDIKGIDRDASRCPQTRYLPRNDGIVQGTTMYKPVCRPEVAANMRHLPACQPFNYGPVPHPPPMNLFKCGDN